MKKLIKRLLGGQFQINPFLVWLYQAQNISGQQPQIGGMSVINGQYQVPKAEEGEKLSYNNKLEGLRKILGSSMLYSLLKANNRK